MFFELSHERQVESGGKLCLGDIFDFAVDSKDGKAIGCYGNEMRISEVLRTTRTTTYLIEISDFLPLEISEHLLHNHS